jgi:hypothetical protein
MFYRKNRNFNLNTSFNLKSIEISIQFIYPISIVNTLTLLLPMTAYIIYAKYGESMTLVNGVISFELCNLVS